jgi:hypothetical protein
VKVYELLDTPDKLSRSWYAQDINGNGVSPEFTEAVKWDVMGAIMKCYLIEDWLVPFGKLCKKVGNINRWSNRTSYKKIIRVLKELDI